MTTDLHLLTGAYACGALEGDERDAFEVHLSNCAQCRDEVRELAETSALLGVAAAEPVPPALRERVLSGIATTRQLSPLVASLAEQAARRKQSVRRRWSISAAACLAVFTIGLGAFAITLSEENSDLRQQSDLIAAVQTAPDARTLHSKVGDTTAALTMSRASGDMVFMAQGLRALQKDRTYQLWLLGPDGARSAGTFSADSDRHVTQLIEGPGDATALALTEEPRGGSARPTSAPVMSMNLPKDA